ATVHLRLSDAAPTRDPFGKAFDAMMAERRQDADEFYERFGKQGVSDDTKLVLRQAFAGLLWSKQFYHLDVKRWQQGDPTEPTPPTSRLMGCNREWLNLSAEDVISTRVTWEHPCYAVCGLAFDCLP